MTALALAIAVLAPVAALVAAPFAAAERTHVVLGVGTAVAVVAWALAAPGTDTFGPVRPDPLAPAVAIGALLGAVAASRVAVDRLSGLVAAGGAALVAFVAGLGVAPEVAFADVAPPERPAVVAVAVAGLVAAVVLVVRLGTTVDTVLVSVAGVAAVVGATGAGSSSVGPARLIAGVLSVGVVGLALRRDGARAAGLLLAPVVLATVARATATGVDPADARAAAAVAVALGLGLAVLDRWRPLLRVDVVVGPLGCVAAALLVLPDPPTARGAGLLLAAGVVLVVVVDRRLATVALWPGAAAAVDALAPAGGTAAGLVVCGGVVVAGVVLATPRDDLEHPLGGRELAALAAALVFAAVPALWAWTDAPGLDGAGRSLGLVLAAVGIGVGLGAVVHVRRDGGDARPAGTLVRSERASGAAPADSA